MRLRIVSLHERYRGFEIGYEIGRHGYLAAWKSFAGWRIGHVYVDRLDEVLPLAIDCIDFNEDVEVAELGLGRRLTMEELCLFGREIQEPTQ